MKIIVRYGKFDIRFCIPCSEDLISVFNDCQSLKVCFIERKIDFFFISSRSLKLLTMYTCDIYAERRKTNK